MGGHINTARGVSIAASGLGAGHGAFQGLQLLLELYVFQAINYLPRIAQDFSGFCLLFVQEFGNSMSQFWKNNQGGFRPEVF